MTLYALCLFCIVLLLDSVQLQVPILANIARILIIIITTRASFNYLKMFVSKKYLIVLVTSLFAVSLLSFSFNSILGVYTAFLIYFSLIRNSSSPPWLLLIFWSCNFIIMIFQFLGVSDIFCLHTPQFFECSYVNFAPYLNPISFFFSTLPDISTLYQPYADLPTYLPLGQLRPPGLFPTQIHFIYLLLLNLLISTIFLPKRYAYPLNLLLSLTIVLSGSQTVQFLFVFLLLPMYPQILPRFYKFIPVLFFLLLAFIHPTYFLHNFSDLFQLSSVSGGRENEFYSLLFATISVCVVSCFFFYFKSRFRVSVLLTQLFALLTMASIFLTHPLSSTFPGALAFFLALLSFIHISFPFFARPSFGLEL